ASVAVAPVRSTERGDVLAPCVVERGIEGVAGVDLAHRLVAPPAAGFAGDGRDDRRALDLLGDARVARLPALAVTVLAAITRPGARAGRRARLRPCRRSIRRVDRRDDD